MNKLYKYKNGKRIRVLKDIECPVCEQYFSPRTSKDKYCSRECYYKMKKIRGDRVVWTDEMRKRVSEKMSGKNNPNYGNPQGWGGYKRPEISGEKHPNWKRGYWRTSDGYKILQSVYTDGKKIPEHRKVVEKFLGRKLDKDEVIHHINGIRDDNRIENLQIMTRAEHMNLHRKDILRNK